MTDPTRTALQELVALKDLKDEESRMRQRRECTRLRGNVDMRRKVDAMRDCYNARKPLAWAAARAALAATPEPEQAGPVALTAAALKCGGFYNWKNQPDRLTYLRKFNGWHQFKKIGDPRDVWCEVLDDDLHMLEETVEAPPAAMPAGPNLLLEWACYRWRAEVSGRPLVNKNRRPLDDTWRQVIRFAGGDPDELVGPSHDALLAASPPPAPAATPRPSEQMGELNEPSLKSMTALSKAMGHPALEVVGDETIATALVKEAARRLSAPAAAGVPAGWIPCDERMPDDGDQVLVWIVSAPGNPGYKALDSWHMYREDPTGMGGPMMEMGYTWRENDPVEVTHWMRVAAPSPAEEVSE